MKYLSAYRQVFQTLKFLTEKCLKQHTVYTAQQCSVDLYSHTHSSELYPSCVFDIGMAVLQKLLIGIDDMYGRKKLLNAVKNCLKVSFSNSLANPNRMKKLLTDIM